MIEINKLTEKDIGRWVTYQGGSGEIKQGRIKSWNDVFIFIVYKCDHQWHKFEDYTGCATKPEDLFDTPTKDKGME